MSQYQQKGSSGWRLGCLLSVVTVLIVCWVVGETLWTPFALFYEWMAQGVVVPPGATSLVAERIWRLVGPLIFLNICWMIYALYRRRSEHSQGHSPLPDDVRRLFPARDVPEAPREKKPTTEVQVDPSRFEAP
jgi:hypothetical protein